MNPAHQEQPGESMLRLDSLPGKVESPASFAYRQGLYPPYFLPVTVTREADSIIVRFDEPLALMTELHFVVTPTGISGWGHGYGEITEEFRYQLSARRVSCHHWSKWQRL